MTMKRLLPTLILGLLPCLAAAQVQGPGPGGTGGGLPAGSVINGLNITFPGSITDSNGIVASIPGGGISFFSAKDGGNNGGSTNSLTYNFSIGGVSNRLLVVGVVGDLVGGNDDITSVTYAGNAMTLLAKKVSGCAAQDRMAYFYYQLNPTTGSNNVVISSTASHYLISGAGEWDGVLQSGQPDAQITNCAAGAASSLTTSVTTITDNSWPILFAAGGFQDVPSAGTGDVMRASDVALAEWGLFDSNGQVHPAGAYSMTTTTSPSSNNIIHIIGVFKPDATVPSPYAIPQTSPYTTSAGADLIFPGCLQFSGYVCCDHQAGADWSIKANNAIAQLGFVTGIIDCRAGFTTPQAMSQTVIIPANVTLLLPAVTITRSAGKQFLLNNYSQMIGVGGSQGNPPSYIASVGTDATTLILAQNYTSYLVAITLSDFGIGPGATGMIGMNLPTVVGSHFYRLKINSDIGIDTHTGQIGDCVCYNDFHEMVISGGSTGLLLDGNQNQFYGGRFSEHIYGAYIYGADNVFYSPDDEGDNNTASFYLHDAQNTIISPYVETTGPITFGPGSFGNSVIGSVANFSPGQNISDLSGNFWNYVNVQSAQGIAPYFETVSNGLVFGGQSRPQLTSGNIYGELSAITLGTQSEFLYQGNNVIKGFYGHYPVELGELQTTSGITEAGKVVISAISTPGPPTVVAVGGTGTNWTYFVVCRDGNISGGLGTGGTTLPSSGTTVSGGAVLSASVYNVITPLQQDGCESYDILKTNTSTSLFLNVVCGSITAASFFQCRDTGQSTAAYVPPTRNSTGDLSVSGNASVTGSITVGSCVGCGGGTTINPTNNVLPKRSNATTFSDSALTDNGSTVTSTEQLLIPAVGSCTSGYSFTGDTSTGLVDVSAGGGRLILCQNGNGNLEVNTGGIAIPSGNVVGWPTGGNGARDTGLSRDAAGVVDVGNGTNGSVSGTLQAAQYNINTHMLCSGTAPTISAHFNTSGDSISANNGTCAFTVTVGTGTAGSTGTVGLPTATTGWVCQPPMNQNRAAYIQQTGGTTSTAVFTNYGTTIGTPVNWTNSDVLKMSCMGY
jgi:hypothetical protein